MASAAKIIKLREEARRDLESLFLDRKNVLVVHYSCESLEDCLEGRTPRITSLVVRNLGTGMTSSFSVHLIAEELDLSLDQMPSKFDEIERQMLERFFANLCEINGDKKIVHWAMRDNVFGFPAIMQRLRALGGEAKAIDPSRLIDASRLLVQLYGIGYARHPRLPNLMEMNDISKFHFLTGEEEVAAFKTGKYYKMHRSTLRKADVIAGLIERAYLGKLKVIRRGNHFLRIADYADFARAHWIVSIIWLVLLSASFVTLLRNCVGDLVPQKLSSAAAPHADVEQGRPETGQGAQSAAD